MSSDFNGTRSIYNRVKALGSFEDAVSIRESDLFILLRLEGTWSGSGYNYKLYRKGNGWEASYTLPWVDLKNAFFEIRDKTYILSNKSSSKKVFGFYFMSENKVEVYCYKNKRYYTLTRK